MKKIVAIALILSLAMEFGGCEAVQRKFTRKKKRKPIRPIFYQEGGAETRPYIELYMMHFTYWKTWHEDLVANAGRNVKRDILASNEIIGNLNDMKKYLKKQKAEELDVYIRQTRDITDQIKLGGSAVSMRLGYLKQKLDNLKARISRKFYYKKIRAYIKQD